MSRRSPQGLNLTPRIAESLVEIERRRSVMEAASTLGMAQSALSRQLSDLETRLGTQLFNRARGFEPTAEGAVLVRWASRMLTLQNNAQAEYNAVLAGEAGLVRLGIAPAVAPRLIPAAIVHFRAHFNQKVRFQIRHEADGRILRDLSQDRLDLAVGRMIPQDHPHLLCRELAQQGLRVTVGPDHPLAAKPDLAWSDLADYPWIIPTDEIPIQGHIVNHLAQKGVAPPPGSIETMSVPLINELLRRDQFIAFYAEDIARAYQAMRHFHILPLQLDIDLPALHCAQRQDVPPPAAVEALITSIFAVLHDTGLPPRLARDTMTPDTKDATR